eukprot:9480051-Alexandrium_andersonii.AAC.1
MDAVSRRGPRGAGLPGCKGGRARGPEGWLAQARGGASARPDTRACSKMAAAGRVQMAGVAAA